MKTTAQNISLLGSTSRVETPFIRVTFGELDSGYTFGVYTKTATTKTSEGFYSQKTTQFPNYIQSLSVKKINGQVNQYSLSLIYPIRPGDDPNFFEKIFSSISKTRKIIFSYGDLSMPDYIYRNEQAIITSNESDFNIDSNSITYRIEAISSAALGYSGNYPFEATYAKPSDEIIALLKNPYYGLTDLFYGMNGLSESELRALKLIPGNDKVVPIEAKVNISALDYLKYLVSCMIPDSAPLDSNNQKTFYVLTIHDDVIGQKINDTKIEILGGPYFQIDAVDRYREYTEAYELTIGAPSKDIVLSCSWNNKDAYSIYYNWQGTLTSNEYAARINDDGEWGVEYAPVISSGNDFFNTRSDDKTWWTKITQFPTSASVTIKGLLRPATLMQYVKLEVLFHGKKHIASGTYIVTEQDDMVDSRGYRTTLKLTRIAGEREDEYVA